MSEHCSDSIELDAVTWTGQQRFRYFVSAVLLPLVTIFCAYCGYKMPARIAPFGEVGFTITILTQRSDLEYAIVTVVQLWTSAAIIYCCFSPKMIVPSYVRATAWIGAAFWGLLAAVLIFKFGILSIASAIVAATLLAAFALIISAIAPTGVQADSFVPSGTRFTIFQIMFLTTVIAVGAAIGAAIGTQSPPASTNSLGWWTVCQFAVGLFELFLLACPILACYAYFRAAVDFRSASRSVEWKMWRV